MAAGEGSGNAGWSLVWFLILFFGRVGNMFSVTKIVI